MNKDSALKTGLVVSLIVAAVSAFIFTPLSDIIYKRDKSDKVLVEKDSGTTKLENEKADLDDRKTKTKEAGETDLDKGDNDPIQNRDFDSYINKYLVNSINSSSISVIIVDESGNLSTSLSSSIANIYNETGIIGNTGLLRNSIIHQSWFQELFEGNSEIIDKLKLYDHADYVAIGKFSSTIRNGILADTTYVCTFYLKMNIISAKQKSLVKSFICSAIGNGVTKDQAKENAIEKFLNKYILEYSSIL